eukprot:CAMPEP_0181264276 /NCGR_PEP_ID=MMETSP1097-20121128/3055_1 /TAXON_ID=35684 /ORGANISM="Pseudopedinella elastica, Strain CCMP716" /LENGTH=126 /DNA_ID=CAMNT_0023363175 /DNA_START=33 /DNA_END=413 /DNA_ORIENTATION=+
MPSGARQALTHGGDGQRHRKGSSPPGAAGRKIKRAQQHGQQQQVHILLLACTAEQALSYMLREGNLPISINSTPPCKYTAVIERARLYDFLLLEAKDRAGPPRGSWTQHHRPLLREQEHEGHHPMK